MALSDSSLNGLIFDQDIKPNHKLILIALSKCDGLTYDTSWLASKLAMANSTLVRLMQELINSKNITIISKEVVFIYNEEESRSIWKDCTIGRTRKPKSAKSVVKAREKLEELRMIGFVGVDSLIARLGREYDRLMLKYTGSTSYSIPPNFFRATRSINWIHFKRLHNLLSERQFPSVPFIESQFRAMKHNSKAGKVYPYPAMLYSTWAINNYLTDVKDSIAREVSEDMFLEEIEVIRTVLESSLGIVNQLRQANDGISNLQAILLAQDSLSPVYLAVNKDYLKHLVTYEQEAPEDITRLLTRFERDPSFKRLVVKIISELEGNHAS